MPWRLIGILIILTLFVIFSGYNAHTITIYLGPFSFPNIPLFVALVMTFILGAFTALPFTIMTSVKKRKKQKQEKSPKVVTTSNKLIPPPDQYPEEENVTKVGKVEKNNKKTRSKAKKK